MSDVTATQMMWQPRLLQLTALKHPDMPEAETTALYLRPDLISKIFRTWVTLEKMRAKGERYEPVFCTYIALQNGDYIHVIEQPEFVAMLRDKALGHEQKPLASPPMVSRP